MMSEPTAKFELLEMTAAHIPAVLGIERRLFPAPWTSGMFEQEVENPIFSRPMVAVENDTVVGYIVSWFLQDEVHLLNVAVLPECQGRGLGRAMLDWLIGRAKETRRVLITLEVRDGNVVARKFYESLGFLVIGMRKNYYAETREDAIVMVLDLGDSAGGAQ